MQIGAGGMARVYLCLQRGPFATNKLAVLKQVRREIASDPQYREMFIDEARIAVRLQHPNVVHTYEVLDETPDYYLAMEFLDGQSLLEVLNRVGRQNLPLLEHVWILTQLLSGLQYAHNLRDFGGRPLNIVHRDVTPSNVFLCQSGEIKLLDFGIAKAAGAVSATRNGLLKGKLGYVSPEQCLGHPATPRSDIYAVGVMLWEAMARKRRASGEVLAAQMQARIQGLEPRIEDVWSHAPAPLAAVVTRALEIKPEARFASALEFQHELERYLAQRNFRLGSDAIRRLLNTHFTHERAALYRTIDSRLSLDDAAGLPGPSRWSDSLDTTLVQANDNRPKPAFRLHAPPAIGRAFVQVPQAVPRMQTTLTLRALRKLRRLRGAVARGSVSAWQRLARRNLMRCLARQALLVGGTLLCGALTWHVIAELQRSAERRVTASAVVARQVQPVAVAEATPDPKPSSPVTYPAAEQNSRPVIYPARAETACAAEPVLPPIAEPVEAPSQPVLAVDPPEPAASSDEEVKTALQAVPRRFMPGAARGSTPSPMSAGAPVRITPGMDLPVAEAPVGHYELDETNPY